MPASSNTGSDSYKDYADDYYDRYLEEEKTADPLRPIRKMLRHGFYFLPARPTITVFAFGHPKDFKRWRTIFAEVYGYEINPKSIATAVRMGFGDYVQLQDCAVEFPLRWHTDVAMCSYLFEHLTDRQILQCCTNMAATAPLNIVRLTMGDDPHYDIDTTHVNRRLRPSWNKLLVEAYRRLNMKPVFSQFQTWCFAANTLADYAAAIDKVVAYEVDSAWHRYRAQQNIRSSEPTPGSSN